MLRIHNLMKVFTEKMFKCFTWLLYYQVSIECQHHLAGVCFFL